MDFKTTEELVRFHLSLYPGMEPEDGIKLLYQSELGGGHLMEDAAAFEEALKAELALPGLFTAEPPAPEPVGGGLCRVHLSSLGGGPGAGVLTALCAKSAAARRGSKQALAQKLRAFAAMAEKAPGLPWPASRVHYLVQAYIAGGCPATHHSARFTALYHPHYRLMDTAAAHYLPVFAAIDHALAQKAHLLVGIDGMCASGKSGLAALVSAVYGCGVVHADDFFLQPHQRTAARLAEPGGNIDYERLAPVARQAGEGRAFGYQVYDCAAQALAGQKEVPAGPLTVLEGAYSLHPKVAAPCDVRIFLKLDAGCQRSRLQRRSPGLALRFEDEWIPMENRYFGAYRVREGCDVVVDTTGLFDF